LFLFVYILLFFACSNAPVKPSKVYSVPKAFYVNDAYLLMFRVVDTIFARVRDKIQAVCLLSRSASWQDSYSSFIWSCSKGHRILSWVHLTFDTSLAPTRRSIPQPITATNPPFLPPNAIFHSPADKPL